MIGKYDAIAGAGLIPGWMTDQELRWLFEVAREYCRGGIVVEVGSWFGRSAWALACGMVEGNLICVDPCSQEAMPQGVTTYEEAMQAAHLERLLAVITNADSMPTADLMPLPSRHASSNVCDETLDMVFIDGDHSYEAVREDIGKWLPKVKAGGILAGHDYGDIYTPGVRRAVEEACNRENIDNLTVVGTIWSFRKE